MLEIKTGVFLGLSIDGVDYPLEKNGFQRLTMVSNKRMSVPTCEIIFSDLTNRINTEVTLADGVPLVIKIGRSIEEYDVYNYRVYNYKRDPARSTAQYTIIGYYDAPKWFLGTWKKPLDGCSGKVLKQMVEACGLKSDYSKPPDPKLNIPAAMDPTSDDMLWLPGNERACMFARSIAEHAYLNDKSCFVTGVTLDGVFKYKNLTTMPCKPPLPIFTQGSVGGTANVIDTRYLTGSGYGNAIGGYKYLAQPQLIHEHRDPIDQLDVHRKTQLFQLNREIKGNLSSGRIDFGDVDPGNVHKHWDRARYQNLRTAMIYSMGVELMLDQRTPLELDLLTAFMYEPYDPPATGTAKLTEQFRGIYYVTAKAIHIEQGNYWEKFQGYITGINKDPDGKGSQE